MKGVLVKRCHELKLWCHPFIILMGGTIRLYIHPKFSPTMFLKTTKALWIPFRLIVCLNLFKSDSFMYLIDSPNDKRNGGHQRSTTQVWELLYTCIREALHRCGNCYTHVSEKHYTGVGTAIHTYQRSTTQVWELLYTRVREALHRYGNCYTHVSEKHYTGMRKGMHWHDALHCDTAQKSV